MKLRKYLRIGLAGSKWFMQSTCISLRFSKEAWSGQDSLITSSRRQEVPWNILESWYDAQNMCRVMSQQSSPNMPDMSGRLLLMSNRELRHCRTFCPAVFNTHKMSDKENENDHWYLPVINWEKCLTGVQNVRQSARGLRDRMSGTPEIIFAISESGIFHVFVCSSWQVHVTLWCTPQTVQTFMSS